MEWSEEIVGGGGNNSAYTLVGIYGECKHGVR